MLINKKFLKTLIVVNFILWAIINSYANLVIFISLLIIFILWDSSDKYLQTKKTLKEFCLWNTWILTKGVLVFYPNKEHPWKKNPPSYENWISNSTQFNIEYSCILTYISITIISLIIHLVML